MFCCNKYFTTFSLSILKWWYEGKLLKLLRFITGLWSPSFLLIRKRLLINFPFWGEVHWIAPFFSPKVLSTWFIFAWRGSEFWLGNFENWSSRLETDSRVSGFLLLLADFFYEILWNFLSTLSNRTSRFMSRKSFWITFQEVLLKQESFIEGFLTGKASEITSIFLKIYTYIFVKMALCVIVFSEHWTISSISCWFS